VNRPLRIAALFLCAGLVAIAVHSDFPLCPMASTFGIPCPGCGLTRATLALLHGNVRAALHFHPLVWLLSPLFIGFVGVAVLELLRDPSRPRPKPLVRWNSRGMNVAATLLLVLTLGIWLARFAGYLGGPVEVTSLRDWLASHH
jgi:hypothetical protein